MGVQSNILDEIEAYTMPMVKSNNKKNIVKHRLGYKCKTGDGDIFFHTLSSFFNDDLVVQDLQSPHRYYNSCEKNDVVSRIFNDSKIVVGFIEKDNDIYIHSWVEARIGNDDCVVDYTKNLVMNKDIYYKLTNAECLAKFNSNEKNKYYELFASYPELDSTVCLPLNSSEIRKLASYIKTRN